MVRSIYFGMTRNCNLQCRHCLADAGPGLGYTTMGLDSFSKAIDHLPIWPFQLKLTGGEPFTLGEKLYDYLDIVKTANDKRGKDERMHVSLQTNGFWARNDGVTEKVIKRVQSYGVRFMMVASGDDYHTEQGLDFDGVSWRIRETSGKSGFLMGWMGTFDVKPVGRGRDLISDDQVVGCDLDCRQEFYWDWEKLNGGSLTPEQELWLPWNSLTVDEKGSVYPCCYRLFKFPGNLVEEPLESVLTKALEDPRLDALFRGGLEAVAVHDGMNEEEARIKIKENGTCGFCVRHLHKSNRKPMELRTEES